jgi:hypothetical protein
MLATALQIAGVALVAIGLGLFFLPLGIIAAGAGCILFGLVVERN